MSEKSNKELIHETRMLETFDIPRLLHTNLLADRLEAADAEIAEYKEFEDYVRTDNKIKAEYLKETVDRYDAEIARLRGLINRFVDHACDFTGSGWVLSKFPEKEAIEQIATEERGKK